VRIKGAIFDLDGTLLDSMSVWENAGTNYLKRIGIEPREGLRDAIISLSLMQAAEYFQREYGVKASVKEIMEGVDSAVEDFYVNEAKPKDGIIGLLDTLRDRGVKMCVATATNRHLVEAGLSRNGMLSYFGRIFTCTEVGAGKDCPNAFNAALEFLGTKREETFVFEDALYAIKTAKAASFPVVAIADESALRHRDEIAGLADIFVNSYTALEVLIK
jgi:haloacid dehalogenase superfamily, subfamily IA, variant 3 with third motif having DD or ED